MAVVKTTVSRRMGFIPLPLGVVMLRVVYTSVKSTNPGAWVVVVMSYLCLLTFRHQSTNNVALKAQLSGQIYVMRS